MGASFADPEVVVGPSYCNSVDAGAFPWKMWKASAYSGADRRGVETSFVGDHPPVASAISHGRGWEGVVEDGDAGLARHGNSEEGVADSLLNADA